MYHQIYNEIQSQYKGKTIIKQEEFDKAHFIHHIVFVVVCLLLGTVDYTPEQVLEINTEDIDKDVVDNSERIIFEVLESTNVSTAKVLKTIKEQNFTKTLIQYLQSILPKVDT